MAWLAIGTPTGTVYTYPQHLPLHCSRQLIRFVEVSNCQKQSVSDAFQNVVLPPRSRSEISKKSARREFASAKVQIPLQLLTILQQIITFIKISVVVAYTIYRDGIGFA